MRFRYAIPMYACKASMQSVLLSCKAPASGASQQHYSSYFLSPFTMNVYTYHPCEYKTIAEMCEERITHTELTELDAHQSNLKIDFLLLSRTFLPVGVTYRMTDNHGFS